MNHVTCLRTHLSAPQAGCNFSIYSLNPIFPTLRPRSTTQLFTHHSNSLQFWTEQSIAIRLLHAESIQLISFEENAIPRYAILSHTWGEDEVSFQDLHDSAAASKTGYQKIRYICEHALAHRLQYVWVDTCCIDKPAALSSLRQSTRCFAGTVMPNIAMPTLLMCQIRWT